MRIAGRANHTSVAALICGLALIGGVAFAPAAAANRPPTGKYRCYSYDIWGWPSYIHWLRLNDRKHYDTSGGGGKYAYRSGTHRILWRSGPYDRQNIPAKHFHESGLPGIKLVFKVHGDKFPEKCFPGHKVARD